MKAFFKGWSRGLGLGSIDFLGMGLGRIRFSVIHYTSTVIRLKGGKQRQLAALNLGRAKP